MRALLFLSALATVPFAADWLRHDLKECPTCKGKKRQFGAGTSRSVCRTCKGVGEIKRFGRR